jgi:RNA polymerase sigma-70 factor (ECF subfamily)
VSDHADAVYAYVRHRLAPRADIVEDVVQEVFVAALGSLPRFSGMSPLRTWLLGIARHKVEDYYRRELRAHVPLSDDDEQTTAVAPEPLIDETIDHERLKAKTHQVLRQLPEQYAIALLWRYWENRSVHDMAEATGKTDKAIERLAGARPRALSRALGTGAVMDSDRWIEALAAAADPGESSTERAPARLNRGSIRPW